MYSISAAESDGETQSSLHSTVACLQDLLPVLEFWPVSCSGYWTSHQSLPPTPSLTSQPQTETGGLLLERQVFSPHTVYYNTVYYSTVYIILYTVYYTVCERAGVGECE